MKSRKQRLHSAELRRLDHIAQSLDRIAGALENLHPYGNNDVIIDKLDVTQHAQSGGKISVIENVDNSTKINKNATAGRGSVAVVDGSASISDVSDSFNTNSNDAIKNLTTALKQ